MDINVNIYDQSAVADFEIESELHNDELVQILRDLQSNVSGNMYTNLRLVVNRENVDYAMEKVRDLEKGQFITEIEKQRLLNNLMIFKNKRNGLSLM